MARKQPKTAIQPNVQKLPKASEEQHGDLLVWRFSSVDKAGPFGWDKLNDPAEYKSVMEKLHQFETMEQNAIYGGGSHPVPLSRLCNDAQKRLKAIKHDDVDQLMSFRLSGRQRVWCRMNNNIMSVLWWDPDHQVCPSTKKHT